MKAIICPRYGTPDVLQLQDVEQPLPMDNEILVEVHAASVNAYDWHLTTADIFLVRLMGGGFFKPKTPSPARMLLGRLSRLARTSPSFSQETKCLGIWRRVGMAPSRSMLWRGRRYWRLKPVNLSFEEAAAVPMAAITALQGLRDAGKIQPGQRVLINGASGGVGTFAVQLAKHFGAEVTAVTSTGKADQALDLGADHVIDYTKEDFTKTGQHYDLILAANGYHPLSDYKRALAPQGIYVMAGGTMRQIFEAMLLGSMMSEKDGRKLGNVAAKTSQKDLLFLKELLEVEKIKPVIDHCYPLNEMPEALRYLGKGHARGKIIIKIK